MLAKNRLIKINIEKRRKNNGPDMYINDLSVDEKNTL